MSGPPEQHTEQRTIKEDLTVEEGWTIDHTLTVAGLLVTLLVAYMTIRRTVVKKSPKEESKHAAKRKK
jgi:hypothetical protein